MLKLIKRIFNVHNHEWKIIKITPTYRHGNKSLIYMRYTMGCEICGKLKQKEYF